jgi:acetyl esterase/lipase
MLKKLTFNYTAAFFIGLCLCFIMTDPKHMLLQLIHFLVSLYYSVLPDYARPMLSADYRAFETLLYLNPLKTPSQSVSSQKFINDLRSSLLLSTVIPRPSLCRIRKEQYAYDGRSVPTYWIDHRIVHEETISDQILLYFHGGGYMVGNIQSKLLMFRKK